MRFTASLKVLCASAVVAVMLAGCGSDNPSAPLAQFQPEIVSVQDNFEFQATGLQNVSATVEYTWANSENQASIDHSSVVTGGTTSVQLFDANGTQVYQSGLLASGTQQADSGAVGNWTVRVTLDSCDGTLNFRAQAL